MPGDWDVIGTSPAASADAGGWNVVKQESAGPSVGARALSNLPQSLAHLAQNSEGAPTDGPGKIAPSAAAFYRARGIDVPQQNVQESLGADIGHAWDSFKSFIADPKGAIKEAFANDPAGTVAVPVQILSGLHALGTTPAVQQAIQTVKDATPAVVNKLVPAAGAAIGAGAGHLTGIPGAPEVGAAAGGYAGKRLADTFKDQPHVLTTAELDAAQALEPPKPLKGPAFDKLVADAKKRAEAAPLAEAPYVPTTADLDAAQALQPPKPLKGPAFDKLVAQAKARAEARPPAEPPLAQPVPAQPQPIRLVPRPAQPVPIEPSASPVLPAGPQPVSPGPVSVPARPVAVEPQSVPRGTFATEVQQAEKSKAPATLEQNSIPVQGLTNSESKALRNVTSANSYALNDVLRTGNPPTNTLATADLASAAIRKAPITTDTTVFRGIRGPEKNQMIGKLDHSDDFLQKIGQTRSYSDPGFVAASSTPEKAAKFSDNQTIAQIEVPAGSNATKLGDLSEFPGEDEVVIDRNTPMTVTGKSVRMINDKPHDVIHLRVIPSAAPAPAQAFAEAPQASVHAPTSDPNVVWDPERGHIDVRTGKAPTTEPSVVVLSKDQAQEIVDRMADPKRFYGKTSLKPNSEAQIQRNADALKKATAKRMKLGDLMQ